MGDSFYNDCIENHIDVTYPAIGCWIDPEEICIKGFINIKKKYAIKMNAVGIGNIIDLFGWASMKVVMFSGCAVYSIWRRTSPLHRKVGISRQKT
ncbi:hypothetical protein PUN28_020748 [Cardiocondyla obscurior]|uniref:Uncharacterized protein n=1 Tax=Cardiocondyla obscurior TaxID=286306 RepID=A0AAW2E915_9HYME